MKLPTLRLPLALVSAIAAVVAAAADARADVSASTNWSGYAVHQTGVSFRTVTATWRQPTASCAAGQRTYSAFWIGLGGYSLTSPALEQIGTEVDCTASGRVSSSAWYELVPAASHGIRLAVRPGDMVQASVSVSGHQVALTFRDRTRRTSFVRRIEAGTVDITSAEWIAEAPSECTGDSNCQTLPLANFGTVPFSGAKVTTTSRRTGSISSPLWSATELVLASVGRQFTSLAASAGAIPTALAKAGAAFAIAYTQQQQQPQGPPQFGTRQSAVRYG
jgi:Peptidase A4 family